MDSPNEMALQPQYQSEVKEQRSHCRLQHTNPVRLFDPNQIPTQLLATLGGAQGAAVKLNQGAGWLQLLSQAKRHKKK